MSRRRTWGVWLRGKDGRFRRSTQRSEPKGRYGPNKAKRILGWHRRKGRKGYVKPDPMLATRDLTIHPRESWDAVPPRAYALNDWSDGVGVVFHHTASRGPTRNLVADERRYMQALQTFHMQVRGWYDGGYNYVVMPSGRVYELRGYGRKGAGVLAHNTGRCHIAIAGTYTEDEPSKDAQRSVEKLVAYLRRRGARVTSIVGHRDLQPSICPGNGIYRSFLDRMMGR